MLNINELNALKFLLNTGKYSLKYSLVSEESVPNDYRVGYLKYYKFIIYDNKKNAIFSYFTPYAAIPTPLESFFKQNYGHILY